MYAGKDVHTYILYICVACTGGGCIPFVVVKFYFSKLHRFTYKPLHKTYANMSTIHYQIFRFWSRSLSTIIGKCKWPYSQGAVPFTKVFVFSFFLFFVSGKKEGEKRKQGGNGNAKRKSMWPLIESMYRSIFVCITCISCTQSYCLFEYMIQLSCVH